ncbi:hypothetical protein V6N13_144379 [Hibiscus sabdariffa]|uniref:Uncharacterized protein n=1 Tax=Hibiscus sabdariffa TaxID=183260 RepID=A0ABR2FK84_9ROSI
MRQNTADAIESSPGSNPNCKSLQIPRLGVKLHIHNRYPVVDTVHLSRSVDQELVFLGFGVGGDHPHHHILEILNHFDGSFLSIQALGLVMGYQLLGCRDFPLCFVGVGGAAVVASVTNRKFLRNSGWFRRLFHFLATIEAPLKNLQF